MCDNLYDRYDYKENCKILFLFFFHRQQKQAASRVHRQQKAREQVWSILAQPFTKNPER